MPQYGEHLRVEHKCRHTMAVTDNPFCKKCGLRMFPSWGPHDCGSPADIQLIRHTAGNILSNMHFYRVSAEVQLAALAEAFAYTLGANVHPARLKYKWKAMAEWIERLASEERDRVLRKTANPNPVMEIERPRLKVKKKKGKPDDVETVQTKSRGRN
jgi:hypothetical protein